MPTVTKLIGPIKTEHYHRRLAWVFVGVVAGKEGEFVRRWKLFFCLETRHFTCKPGRPVHGDEKLSHDELFDFGRLSTPLKGKVTPMLRSRLKPEHIAEATRLALNFKGKPSQ